MQFNTKLCYDLRVSATVALIIPKSHAAIEKPAPTPQYIDLCWTQRLFNCSVASRACKANQAAEET